MDSISNYCYDQLMLVFNAIHGQLANIPNLNSFLHRQDQFYCLHYNVLMIFCAQCKKFYDDVIVSL